MRGGVLAHAVIRRLLHRARQRLRRREVGHFVQRFFRRLLREIGIGFLDVIERFPGLVRI